MPSPEEMGLSQQDMDFKAPNKSQRIENPDEARLMADASKAARSGASAERATKLGLEAQRDLKLGRNTPELGYQQDQQIEKSSNRIEKFDERAEKLEDEVAQDLSERNRNDPERAQEIASALNEKRSKAATLRQEVAEMKVGRGLYT